VHPGYPKTIAIHGDRGSAVIEHEDVLRWDFNPPTPADEQVKERFAQKVGASGGASDPSAISHRGHMLQLSDFVAAIRENRVPQVDGREGRKAVATICAIYDSARTGKVIAMCGDGGITVPGEPGQR
jgi:predicted dehydrogenase